MKILYIGIIQTIVWILISFLWLPFDLVSMEFLIPDRSSKVFADLQAINLGVLMPMSAVQDTVKRCSGKLKSLSQIHSAQPLEYAIQEVNKKYKFPWGKIGFVLIDDCYTESETVSQSLAFISVPKCAVQGENIVKPYEVIGIIGSTKSSQTIALSEMMSSFEIPVVSFRSTSDQLSDKASHPYFLRTVPPDKFQFQAISTFIDSQGWSYVSVVYEEGSYGENGYSQLKEHIMAKNNCLAVAEKIPYSASDEEIQTVVEALIEKRTARVVVMITYVKTAFKVINSTPLKGNFIWIASDAWSEELRLMKDLGTLLLGSVLVVPHTSPALGYSTYFKTLSPSTTKNPWFPEFWEETFDCSLDAQTCSSSLALAEPTVPTYVSRLIDTIDVYANATYRTFNKWCKNSSSNVRQCFNGDRLLVELKNTDQDGYTGHILIDENGDRLGTYNFFQVIALSDGPESSEAPFKTTLVGSFNPLSGTYSPKQNLTWKHHSVSSGQTSPESICSSPCGHKHAEVHQENVCCWICQACRSNEYVTIERTHCKTCSLYTWPDANTNWTSCKDIPVDKPDFGEVTVMLELILASISVTSCLAVLVFFVRHMEKSVFKNSLPQLSFIILLSILLGNVTVVIFQFEPNDLNCKVIFLLFCLSFALMYGSLVIRTFVNLNTFTLQTARYKSALQITVAPRCQVILTLGLVLIQILICSAVILTYSPWHQKTMKDTMKDYVELRCNMSDIGMVSFVVYNLLMIVICTCLAFKTRRLKINFNESAYISICMYSTIVFWLTIIPAYIVAAYEYIKVGLMAFILLSSQALVLGFLFVPKIYAVLFNEDTSECSYSGAPTSESFNYDSASASGFNKSTGSIPFPHRKKTLFVSNPKD